MSLLEAIVLGIVQGLTEFLPISSTGHLRIVPAFLGWEDPGAAFTAVTQLGTMAAVLLYFRVDLMRIARAWLESVPDRPKRRELDARLGWYIVLGTVPIGVFGVLFKDQIETGARDLYVIGVALIVVGLIMSVADHVGTRERQIEQIETKDGFWVGHGAGARAGPGRIALRGHDHDGALPRPGPRGCGAVLVPPVGAGGRPGGAVRALVDHRGRGGRARRAPARSSSPLRSRSSWATPRSRSCSASSRPTRCSSSSPTGSCSASSSSRSPGAGTID